MEKKIESLHRAVMFGVETERKNLVVDLDVLCALFAMLDDSERRSRRAPGPATARMLEHARSILDRGEWAGIEVKRDCAAFVTEQEGAQAS